MSEIGDGLGSSYPTTLDTDNTPEVNSPSALKTKARAEVPNDLAACIIAIETELGTDPAGTSVDLKTYLQTEHATDGTHGAITPTSVDINGTILITGTLDEDDMVSDSAVKLATQQSIKAYVDAQVTAQDLDVSSDSGTIAVDLDSEVFVVAGGAGIDTSAATKTLTVAIDSTVATLADAQELSNKTLPSAVLNTGVSGTAVLDEDDMVSDSAVKLATQQSIKAYVDTAIAPFGARSVRTETTTYTAVTGDSVIICNGASFTVTLYAAVGNAGKFLDIKNIHATGVVTIDGNGTETIDGGLTVTIPQQYGSITVLSDGTNWNII